MIYFIVNRKSRGNWGEYQLNTLLSIYAGESQKIRISSDKISKNIEKINEGKIEEMTEHKTGIMED